MVYPDFTIIAQFAVATIVIALTPGPDMTLFIGRTLSQGRAAGLACMSGALTGVAIHTSLVVFGLSALISASPRAFVTLKIVGGVYLLWLAYQAVRHGSAFRPQVNSRQRQGIVRNWATGLTINLVNPKIVLFFMTFLPQFVSVEDPHAASKLYFLGAEFIIISLPILIPLIFVADRLAETLRHSPRVSRIMDWLFAGVFSVFAARIFAAESISP